MVITIDGPAGSGKSSTARAVARRLGFRHLDSGSLYRALTLAARQAGVEGAAWDAPEPDVLRRIDVSLEPTSDGFEVRVAGEAPGEALRSPEITALVPRLAQSPEARAKLGDLQRSALAFGDLVADGRDMGTVVFPDADLKVYLTASIQERSRRRLEQEGRSADAASVQAEARRIEARDETDSGRTVAPLRKPDGALELDTTNLSFDEQVERIVVAASGLTAQLADE